ncbi:Crp/Fnr family transcriptional regulator [Dehalococcoides mccartyi]|uniref:Transcriptional regulator, Crp/Fnr family n=1 Tax=Dehalococcoides mccartyi (strain ATCC BAA-2266 / KCTC 15142 / 195) TaxID=243164 RepID=Q3Z9Q2_DEHM1|nr:Crp/Fnr family transcriptional regulator [Dehalococcoides mccartyi]AAW40376.1 transcriptional regulator, Crp/Fnr family [Dehalococcoides mccartyi 195]
MKYLNCMMDLWLFDSLNPQEKTEISRLFRRPEYLKNEYLFSEGEPASAVFVVAKGRVKLFKTAENGREIILAYLTQNQLFGEEILFNDAIRTITAVAMEDTRLCACYKSDFENLLSQNSQIAVKVIRTLSEKINNITETLADMAIYDIQNRLARTLARLAKEHGEDVGDGRRLNFRLTHDDLGSLVGASRVMVTNVIKSLKKSGIIKDDIDHKLVVSQWFLNDFSDEMPKFIRKDSSACKCFPKPGE